LALSMALADENAAERVGVFPISIENQIPLATKEAIVRVGQTAGELRHP